MRASFPVAICCLFSAFGRAEPPPINIYMWEDSLSPHVAHKWQTLNNQEIKISNFDNDDERNLLMMNSPQLPFDIIVLDNISAKLYGDLGAFDDLSTLQNTQNNAPKWNQACGRYAIPYFWGNVGITYRKDRISNPPQTWAEFLSPAPELRGHVGMITDTVETLLPALSSLGLSPITDNANDLHQAYSTMQAALPNIASFEYILSYVRSHADVEDISIAMAYSGDNYALNRYMDKPIWGYVVPKGEPYIWVDCMAINKHSKNKQQAKALLEYLSTPQVAAENAQYVRAATPNLSALKLMPDWYLNDSTLFPEQILTGHGLIDTGLSANNINLRAKIIHKLLKDHETQH
ncbi:spermidine/putrescine transport system substrate-binding protein [Vibrio xiamenensis]|uniref:Spermidine/putrescine transport system substrate-binding protein n=2 Tax=Vibrio xiamenensis TaxID=861298 RepID=A0A1G8B3N5_9VIBR|nr:spermidine/putrescine transport system substrate-binding protein [Vibrio xiamenensis]